MSRESILKANDLKREPIEVPEWGGALYIREMGGAELKIFQDTVSKSKAGQVEDELRLLATTAVLCLCDEKGDGIFSLADVEQLSKKSPRVLKRVGEAALSLSGMKSDAVGDAEKK